MKYLGGNFSVSYPIFSKKHLIRATSILALFLIVASCSVSTRRDVLWESVQESPRECMMSCVMFSILYGDTKCLEGLCVVGTELDKQAIERITVPFRSPKGKRGYSWQWSDNGKTSRVTWKKANGINELRPKQEAEREVDCICSKSAGYAIEGYIDKPQGNKATLQVSVNGGTIYFDLQYYDGKWLIESLY